ncbi:hypothetical protein MTYP_00975 [Methylophilaceae bacterium]|nr:hypothetical protein MTYP_00975 [Methylophilaceae bacterium]
MFTSKTLRLFNYLVFASLALFVALTFRQYGISNDEEVQHVYGRRLLDFYASGFADQSAFHYRNLYLYGGFFDLIAAGIERLLALPADSVWIWDMRHLLSALFGLGGILAAYKTARIFGGERAGLFAVVLLSVTGTWAGAMFTHTKDIPFAACMAWASYYIILISQELPKPRLSLGIKLGIAVGCALGLRVGAGFAVLYLLLVVFYAMLCQPGTIRQKLQYLVKAFLALIPAGVVAWLLMALFWPWGVMSPEHPLEAVRSFSHFTFNMLTVMDGDVMNIGDVPRSYLLAYLTVRLPEIFLLGLLAAAFLGIRYFYRIHPCDTFFLAWIGLLLAALFPLAFALWDKPALYNGIRHFTFVLPPLAVIAAIGLSKAWEALRAYPKSRLAGGAVSAALLLNTLFIFMELHPYQYVYYNHLAGNIKEAEKEWEGDYWSSSIREAALMLDKKIGDGKHPDNGIYDTPYRVAVCAESIQADTYLDHDFQITSDWISADFFISSTNMNCDKVLQGKIIGKVERLGVVLAVIKDRRDLLAHQRRPHPAPN